jgi:hypothetical protein
MNFNEYGLTWRTPVSALRAWRKPSKGSVSTDVARDDVSTRDRANYTVLVLTTQLLHVKWSPQWGVRDLIKINTVALFHPMNATYQFVWALLNTELGSLSEPPTPGVKHALQNAAHHAKWIIYLFVRFIICL